MPLARRFTLTFGALILVLFLVASLLLERHLSSMATKQTEARVCGLARSFLAVCTPSLLTYDYITLQQIADDAMKEPDVVQVVILDKEGMIAGMTKRRDLQGRRADDPISLRGAIASEGFFIEGTEAGGNSLERVEPVVGEDGTRWGTIRVSLSNEWDRRQAREARFLILAIGLGGALLVVAASHFLARRITRPLSILLDQAQGLANGHWDPEARIETGDEIEVLAARFRQTAESLERQKQELIRAHDDLAALNATLEEKVLQRTAELRDSQEKYRLLVEASPDPISLVQKGRFRYVNRAFLATFGYTEAQVTADPAFSLEKVLHPDFVRVAGEVVAQGEHSGEPVDTEWVGIGRGGRSLDLQVRGRRIVYEAEPALELIWFDMTDKKRLLRQVVQSERLRAIGEMTGMVAHNFNNLLSVILGRAQLLESRVSDPAQKKGLEMIRNAATQGAEIVKRIQEYSGETSEAPYRSVQIGSLLKDVILYLENLWRTAGEGRIGPIQFEVQAENVPPVLGSEALLSDVLKHVLTNAAEAMPKGGTIRVLVHELRDSLQITVEDSGVGMTPEVRRRAFDPFYTTKGSRTRGLGLSASYGIIQRHRGRIDLRPLQQGGTAVDIFLPILKAARPGHEEDVDSPALFHTEEQEAARRALRKLRRRPAGDAEEEGPAPDRPAAAA